MDDTPTQSDDAAADCTGATMAISTRPATYSLVLAILLRLSPVGMDPLAVAIPAGLMGTYLALAACFYALILLPLYFMFRRHGRAAWRVAPKRIVATLVIVALSLAVDAMVVYSMIAAKPAG